MQVSVLSKNVKSKHYTGYVAFHVHIMYSPNHGIYLDAVEDDSIQMWFGICCVCFIGAL